MVAFAAKVLGGVAYGLVYYHFYHTGDVVHYFQDSRKLWAILADRPGDYFHLVFGYARSGEAPAHLLDVYETLRGSWRTQEFMAVRVHGVLNLITAAHFYANTVILCMASTAGLVLLHAAFHLAWPARSAWMALPIFFLPSTVFWCSGIHKDAFALGAIGVMLYTLSRVFQDRTAMKPKHVLAMLAATFLLLNTRSYLLWLLLPNLLVLVWGWRKPGPHALRFAILNVGLMLLLSQAAWLHPRLDLLERMAFEQKFLLQQQGNAHLPMPEPARDLKSLLANLPMALDHVFWQPLVYPAKHGLQRLTALVSFSQLLVFAVLIWRIPWRQRHPPLAAFSLFFGLGVFLLVGLTTPALGAIVRYKAGLLPLLYAAGIGAMAVWNVPLFQNLMAKLPHWAQPSAWLLPEQ
jgi:hypothetical protein